MKCLKDSLVKILNDIFSCMPVNSCEGLAVWLMD
jgi:hypothetical protein